MQNFSYHTHTTFSDGNSSAEEMITRAKELGWQEIGISDHLTVHKNIKNLPDYNFTAFKRGPVQGVFLHQSFADIKEEALRHFDNIERLAKKHNINVLKGFEVDWFTYSGWQEELVEFIKETSPDYLVSGNHYFASENGEQIFDLYYLKHHAAPAGKELGNYMKRHYKTIQEAVKSGLFSFVAHLDYSRAVGTSIDMFKEEKIELVKKLAEYNVAVELSTKGLRRQGVAYPAPWLLDVIKEYGVKVVISDDAHSTQELGALFDQAESLLQDLKYTNRFKIIK